MQPPISLGTMLQQRYRVTKILGQGGFGRTYLAQDTGCFDELCVLKEFSPTDRGRDAMKKSKELFQREAQVLYQINHPQIPKFRANFEEQKRLFLVQEYAEGKTVAKSLSERLKNSQTYTEQEAVEFLKNMLPVLSHIHNMGIIHRDISPDNIIFRDRDKLPVLIDFGVVKAGVTQLEVSTQVLQGTTVGKAGYAPGEQLQTGEAYANSDLYALAVTVVVMMTGRKPESLIDRTTMTWKWHQWVPTLSPWFAKILNKMLSRIPSSRYQSATEVAQALRSVSDFVGNSADPTPSGVFDQPSTLDLPHGAVTPQQQPAVPLSRVKRQTSFKPATNVRSQPPQLNPLRGILSSPWGVALGSAAAAGLFVVLPLFLVGRAISPTNHNNPLPSPAATTTPVPSLSPSPTPQAAQTPTPSPVATAPPVSQPVAVTAENLLVEPGKPTIKEGTIAASQPTVLAMNLSAGQQLTVTLTPNPPGATMNIMAPNQANVDVFAKNTVNWRGNLPLAGEYRIEIVPAAGATSDSNYRLEVTVTTPTTTVTPGSNPLASPPITTPSATTPLAAPPVAR